MDFGRRRLWWAWSGKPNLKSACFRNISFYNRKQTFSFKIQIFTMNYTPHLSAVCGELALASRSWKLCASETPVFTMKNTLLLKKHQFLQWNLHLWWALSGELALASLWWGWLWWLGSAKLAPWISPKIKCKKKVRPSAAKCVNKMKMDFGRRRLWWAWSGKPSLKSACFQNISFYNTKRNCIF